MQLKCIMARAPDQCLSQNNAPPPSLCTLRPPPHPTTAIPLSGERVGPSEYQTHLHHHLLHDRGIPQDHELMTKEVGAENLSLIPRCRSVHS